jgi:transcriptional regulator with XRE-family HTH domain
VDKALERLKTEFTSEGARYAYADAVTNAFLTAQIKALREERGLTQEELAELVGTQQSGISRWLNSGFSTCKVETLRKFAKAYGVRLRISFESFGTLPRDVMGFTKGRLAPPRFEDDPALKEPVPEPEPEEAFAGTNTPRVLAGMKFGDQIPNWDTRLAMAEEIMKWSEIRPQSGTLQSLASAKPINPSSVPSDDPYKGLRIAPQQPSPKRAITPTNQTNGSGQHIGGLQIRLDFETEPEDKEAA